MATNGKLRLTDAGRQAFSPNKHPPDGDTARHWQRWAAALPVPPTSWEQADPSRAALEALWEQADPSRAALEALWEQIKAESRAAREALWAAIRLDSSCRAILLAEVGRVVPAVDREASP